MGYSLKELGPSYFLRFVFKCNWKKGIAKSIYDDKRTSSIYKIEVDLLT